MVFRRFGAGASGGGSGALPRVSGARMFRIPGGGDGDATRPWGVPAGVRLPAFVAAANIQAQQSAAAVGGAARPWGVPAGVRLPALVNRQVGAGPGSQNFGGAARPWGVPAGVHLLNPNNVYCYNCGSKDGHLGWQCQRPGPQCYLCHRTGHNSVHCPDRRR